MRLAERARRGCQAPFVSEQDHVRGNGQPSRGSLDSSARRHRPHARSSAGMVVPPGPQHSHHRRHPGSLALASLAKPHSESQIRMREAAESAGLLQGYRVLDLTSAMGAFCGKLLRDLGMDVIKVEPPAGDALRSEPPFANGHVHREGSLCFAYLNAGKRGITGDITKKSGRKLLLDLVARSDIVGESFEPGHLAAQNLSYESLIERQKKLILVSISGFGQDGPYSHFKTPDIVGTAMGGLLYISGDPGLAPCNPPETHSYCVDRRFTACGLLLALWQRETRGIGAWIDASIQASMALHEHVALTTRPKAGS